jgi:hypothetical protein
MSKYDPLGTFLAGRPDDEIPLSFGEVERILGFRLPDSARNWPAWWSNNPGTHVGVRVWRDAGWKTSRVDLGSERVTFVRDRLQGAPGMAEAGPAPFTDPADRTAADGLSTLWAGLSRSAVQLLDDYAQEAGVDRIAALKAVVEAAAATRRRQLLDSLPVATMPVGHDSAPFIREDRDAR